MSGNDDRGIVKPIEIRFWVKEPAAIEQVDRLALEFNCTRDHVAFAAFCFGLWHQTVREWLAAGKSRWDNPPDQQIRNPDERLRRQNQMLSNPEWQVDTD